MRDAATAWLATWLCCLALACSTSDSLPSEVTARDAGVRADAGKRPRDAAAGGGADDRDAGGQAHGSVRGRIDGPSAQDARSGVVIAEMLSQRLGSNYFFLDHVPSGAERSLFARIPGYSLGQARLRVDEGRTTALLLAVTRMESQPISDPKAEHTFLFGPASARHGLHIPKAALVTSYGTQPDGLTSFSAAALGAESAPAGMWVDDGGKRYRFRSFAMVELRAAQPGAALALTQKATLRLSLAASDAAQLQIYRFDESAGLWRPYAQADQDLATHTLSVAIDGFGIYAAGQALDRLSCVALSVADGTSHAVANAAVRYADAQGSEGTQVWTDESGRACLPASSRSALSFSTLALVGEQVESSSGKLQSGDAPQSCGAECADGGVSMITPAAVRCVRGQIAPNGAETAVALWAGSAAGPEQSAGEAMPGQAFCVDIGAETQLRFGGALRCGEPRPLPAAQAAASCGQNSCLELGTIQCCADVEYCGNAVDDDCDQKVDEGCQCGSADCTAPRAAHGNADFCCTDNQRCGLRDRENALDKNHCFDIQTKARDDSNQCPDEVLDLGKGKQGVAGCCRADQRCGLQLPPADCLPREDAKYFVLAGTPALAAKSCRF
jgi:hypothetical protein